MKITLKLTVLLIVVLSSFHAKAQSQGEIYQPDTNWKVYAYSAERTLGFSGGFNNPQFAMGDLNNDGRQDLVVFEKGSVQVKTFINYGTAGNPNFKYRPRFERNFPETNGKRAVAGYMKLEYINCDNAPDLITRGMGGYAIYYGYFQNNELHFNYLKDLFYSPLYDNSESFEQSPFPTQIGWKTKAPGWSRVTSGTNPTASPQDGTAMAMFNSKNLSAGTTSVLLSKKFRISPNLGAAAMVSLWIYRDNASGGDSLSIYTCTDTSLNNMTFVGRIARSRNISQPDTKASDGWYQYTFPIPTTVVGNSIYLAFKGISLGGNNIFIDNVYWVSSKPTGDVNAYVDPGGDIPGVADIDNDGDLDFLSFNISGGYIDFYKNYRVEENLPCDTLHVNRKTGCWGKILQGGIMQQVLGVNCPSWEPIHAPAKTTHTGNTLCFLDFDGDGDWDYLNGGVSYSYIQLLKNGRVDYNNARDTITAQDTTFQTGGHVYHASQFPAAFYLDIDQDGNKDILISPSAEAASENYNCVAYYRNTGTVSSPVYTYQSDTFMIDRTIDMGANSVPVIYDYNKDGKPDLFLGSDGFFQPGGTLKSRIAYFQNTSNGNNLSFTLMDNDFLGLDAQNIQGAYPAIGDLDFDGKDDFVVGHSSGTISFYKNMAASASAQPQWQMNIATLKDINNNSIDSSYYAFPLIYDINNDGKKDLIIGTVVGWLFYYQNVSPGNQVSLQYQSSKLGMVKADPMNSLNGFSVPFIGKIDNTNTEYMLVGSNSGLIRRYTGFQNGNVTTPYQVLDTMYATLNYNLGAKSGFRSAPAVADLDGDGKYEMILGNSLGGITIFKQMYTTTAPEVAESAHGVTVFPNPAKTMVYVHWERDFASTGQVMITVSNISGQKLVTRTMDAANGGAEIPVTSLSSGIYFCEVVSGAKRDISKLVILK